MAPVTEVKKIVYGGWGLAHHEGRTLFLPYAAPGDRVEFSIVKEKKNCLFGRIAKIIDPSPRRQESPCPVFGECGGCHFLHLSYEDEIEIKKENLLENMERIGKIHTTINRVIPSPERFGYRNHSVFKVDENGHAGFTKMESLGVVPFPPEGCLLLPEEMRASITALPAEELPLSGEVRVRMDRYGAVHFFGLPGRAGPPEVLMEAGGCLFPVNPSAFFQVNRYLNDSLMNLAVSLPLKVRRRLIDLYCGVGFFTLPLSRMIVEGVGIERDGASVKNAWAAARLNKVANVRFKKGAVEKEIHKLRDVDILIADPPRAGIPASALKGIIRLRPRELILVSCEPPTLARDAARLVEAGYILSEINMVDLFPGTYHIETMTLFRRS